MIPSDSISDLQELEVRLHDLINPFLNQPDGIEFILSSSHKQLHCELWKALNGGGEIVLSIHKSLDNTSKMHGTDKSFKTFIAIKTGMFIPSLINTIDNQSPPFNADEFGMPWLRQAHSIWKDKLAGLYMKDINWIEKPINCGINELGILKGKEWLKLLKKYLKYKNKRVQTFLNKR